MINSAVLTRAFKTNKVTLGMFQIENVEHDPIYTLENPWVRNEPFISCIPETLYIMRSYDGTEKKGVFIVEEVEGRTGILFHAGNTELDTEGCILVGMAAGTIDGIPAVLNSRDAMSYLRLLLGKEPLLLQVK